MLQSKMAKFMEFMFVFIFINFLSTCKGFHDELELLLSLKASLNDQSLMTNWNSSLPHCKWNGITCFDSSHVSEIELRGKTLSGKIPESIFRFPYIQSIDLSSNQLFGEIPKNLSSCLNLKYLNLSSNNLTGLIPSAQYLPSLETLDLTNNMLSGEIPENIGLFSGLRVLDFGGNALSGKIPGSIANMTKLEFLTLASNHLTGEIPGNLGLMRSLKWIYLGHNNIYGKIPGEFGELISLKHLDLVYNNLTGEIPSSLGNLTNLEYLFLYFNKLTGEIPKPIFNLRKLVSLDFSDNSLSGEIPEMLINLQSLEILHLFSNNFSGNIPRALSSLSHLKVLQLWSNGLSGEIPKELGKYNNLALLDLSTNNLTGKIPENLCASGNLFKLILFSNSLEGEIPGSLSLCRSLQRVRIQQNRLSGGIPPEFTTLPLVYFLDISSNYLSGRIDNRKWDMPQVRMLSLSRNGLFGPLPVSFGSKKLEKLDLSGNNFSGSIPERFGGEFSEVMELNLSGNELSGQIPYQLSYCKKLVNLDLSHNHLFGEIPVSLAALPVLGQLDLSVNGLSGKIPVNLGQVSSLVQVNISYNNLHGNLPSTGAFLAINSSAVIGNHLCGGEKITDLPPCNGDKNRFRWYVITFLLASLAMFAIVMFIAIFIRKGKFFKGLESNRVESENSTWELQFLDSKVAKMITVKDIVSAIKEENLVASGKTGSSYEGNNKVFLAKEIDLISASYEDARVKFRKINHPNVVKMLAMCRSEKGGILVYEYIEGKDLSEAIGWLIWERRIKVAVGIARAIKYLHFSCSPSVVVGEITPRKIMVDEKGEAHLRLSIPGINIDSKCYNSSAYVAPETKGSKELTEKSDIYGFGLLLIELLTGKSPCDAELGIHGTVVEWATYCYSDCHFEMWVDRTIIKNINQAVMNDYQNQIVETMDLALQCTAGDPAARPCAVDLVKNLESVVRSSSCRGFKLCTFC